MAHTAELVVINRVQTAWFAGAEGPLQGPCKRCGGPGSSALASAGVMICLDLQGLTTSDIPVNAGVHNPTHLPTYDDRLFEGAAPSPAQEGCAFASRCWPKA